METLTWTGSLGPYINPILGTVVSLLAISAIATIMRSFAPETDGFSRSANTKGPKSILWNYLSPGLIVGLIVAVVAVLYADIKTNQSGRWSRAGRCSLQF